MYVYHIGILGLFRTAQKIYEIAFIREKIWVSLAGDDETIKLQNMAPAGKRTEIFADVKKR